MPVYRVRFLYTWPSILTKSMQDDLWNQTTLDGLTYGIVGVTYEKFEWNLQLHQMLISLFCAKGLVRVFQFQLWENEVKRLFATTCLSIFSFWVLTNTFSFERLLHYLSWCLHSMSIVRIKEYGKSFLFFKIGKQKFTVGHQGRANPKRYPVGLLVHLSTSTLDFPPFDSSYWGVSCATCNSIRWRLELTSTKAWLIACATNHVSVV